MTVVAYSVFVDQTSYQGCSRTKKNATAWKPKQMRIWVSTENSKGAEIKPEGGRRGTNSFHAGFKLTKRKKNGKR